MLSARTKKSLIAVFGVAFGLVCFWLAARNVQLDQAVNMFLTSDKRWVELGIAIFGVSILFRSLRWQIVLSHVKPVNYVWVAYGLTVGYAINIILPARLGEFFRADFTSRITSFGRSALIGSIMIERVMDLFAIIMFFALGMLLSGAQSAILSRVLWAGLGVMCFGILCIGIILWVSSFERIKVRLKQLIMKRISSHAFAAWLERVMRDFSEMVQIVRTPRIGFALILTFPIWALEAAAMFAICRAVGLRLLPDQLMVLLGGASLSTLFPSAPGFLGSYQFGYLAVLRNFSVPDTLSLVSATAVQIYLMGTYAVVGLALWFASWMFSMARVRPSAFLPQEKER
jgi:uncharacterized protein (TIRG00374 family)